MATAVIDADEVGDIFINMTNAYNKANSGDPMDIVPSQTDSEGYETASSWFGALNPINWFGSSAQELDVMQIKDDVNNTLKIYNTGGSIVDHLTRHSSSCASVKMTEKGAKVLGQGAYGTAYAVNINGMPFAMKKVLAEVEFWAVKGKKTVIEFQREQAPHIPLDLILMYNPGVKGDDIVKNLDIPAFYSRCLTTKDVNIQRVDKKGVVHIPAGSYMCEKEIYSEYIIGILLGNLYDTNSINFFKQYNFYTCPSEEDADYYIFMEKIDTTLSDLLKSGTRFSLEDAYSIMVQLIHAIATYQKIYNVSHNDLHPGNIFIKYVTDETIFNGEKLKDATYFSYTFGDTTLYVPASRYIVKIGDFGLSVKYTVPMIGNKECVKSGFFAPDWDGIEKPFCANWYCPAYDMIYILAYLFMFASQTELGRLAKDLLRQLVPDGKTEFFAKDARPVISNIHKFDKDAEWLFTSSSLTQDLLQKPLNEQIAVLGYTDVGTKTNKTQRTATAKTNAAKQKTKKRVR